MGYTAHLTRTVRRVWTMMNVIQGHSMSFTVITPQLRLLAVSLSLTLPLDEPVVIDAKEDKELAPSDMSARSSLHSPGAGSVLLYFVHPPVSLRGLRTFCEMRLLLCGVAPRLCFGTLLPACSITLGGWITCIRNFLAAHCDIQKQRTTTSSHNKPVVTVNFPYRQAHTGTHDIPL